MEIKKYRKYVEKFSKVKILVVGDLMVDKFVYGNVSRLSPEAPVPVVEVTDETHLPGGAGNVANNIIALGARVCLASVIGDDLVGKKLKYGLFKKNMITDGILMDDGRPTTIKTRIIARHQQVVRFDREDKKEISQALIDRLSRYIHKTLPGVSAVLISDYGKGVIKPDVLSKVISWSRRQGIFITVDPKTEHFNRYRKVSCVTPNLSEAMAGMGVHKEINTKEEIIKLGKRVLKRLDCQSVMITQGEKGMSVFEKNKNKTFHIPTTAKEVFDVTGAGDTVIAVLTLGLAAGAPLRIAAEIANYAAGVVVGKLGTATVSPQELVQAMNLK